MSLVRRPQEFIEGLVQFDAVEDACRTEPH